MSIDYAKLLTGTPIISASEMVYGALKEAILSERLAQGQQLNEREIAKQLETSVTPVKDALRKLEKEGLVTILPRKGTFVAEGIMNSIEEIYMVRSALEGVAAQLAAQKITDEEIADLTLHMQKMEGATKSGDVQLCATLNREFHSIIREISHNSYIIHQLKVIRTFESAIQTQLLSEKDELVRAFEDHKQIYEAIIRRDEQAAETMSRNHCRRTIAYVKSLIAESKTSS